MGRERKLWLTQRADRRRHGARRSTGAGPTRTRTRSRSASRCIAGTPGLRYAIVRPSIVESALRYPFPGWNEGFTTSAPLAFAGHQGPAAHPRRRARPSWTSSRWTWWPARSSPSPPATLHRRPSAASTSWPRATRTRSTPRARWSWWGSTGAGTSATGRRAARSSNDVQSRLEPQPVSKRQLPQPAPPRSSRSGARLLRQGIEEPRPTLGRAARLGDAGAGEGAAGARWRSRPASLSMLIDLFLPFLWENRYVFRCDNTRSRLRARWTREDAAKIPWDPDAHRLAPLLPRGRTCPGLEKWVFPGLEEETREAQGHPRPPRPARAVRRRRCTPTGTGWPSGGWRTSARSASPTARCTATPRGWASFLLRRGREARRPGAARLREPARVGHRLLRHPARRRHRGAGGPGARARPRWSTSPAAAEARRVPALRGGRAGPARAVTTLLARQRWRPSVALAGPGDGGRRRPARTASAPVQKSAVAGRRGLAHLHLRAPPARPRA